MAKNNRDTLYVVLRKYGILNTEKSVHCIDVCRTLERAEELKTNYEFEYLERGLVGFKFIIQPASYVDE